MGAATRSGESLLPHPLYGAEIGVMPGDALRSLPHLGSNCPCRVSYRRKKQRLHSRPEAGSKRSRRRLELADLVPARRARRVRVRRRAPRCSPLLEENCAAAANRVTPVVQTTERARTSAEHVAAASAPPHALRERTPGVSVRPLEWRWALARPAASARCGHRWRWAERSPAARRFVRRRGRSGRGSHRKLLRRSW